MKVRFYTVQKMRAPGDARPHFWLVAYDSDELDLPITRAEEVVRAVRVDRALPYSLFSMESDPEFGYSLPSRFVKHKTRHRALVLWSKGKVLEIRGSRP